MQTILKVIDWKAGTTAAWLAKAGCRDQGGQESPTTPLIVVHGGPGLPHQYLLSLSRLAERSRPVVFYDQLGCGQSRRHNGITWNLDVFTEELRQIINSFAKDGKFDLIGHSSGGWIALELLLSDSSLRERLRKLVLASVPLDVPAFISEQRRIIKSLGGRAERRLLKPPPSSQTSRAGRTYLSYYNLFLRSFICRSPWPVELVEAMSQSGEEVYSAMWGGSEVWPTGQYVGWSCTARIGVLDAPVLLTSGQYDEVTPSLVSTARSILPNSSWRLFENSAHMAHIEEADVYVETVSTFLNRPGLGGDSDL